MRFQQLKHNPNTIVRKKLYKSGKNWVVMSSLAFASGLILLGASTTNVSADPVDDTTDDQSNTEQVVEQPAEKTDPEVMPQDVKDTGDDEAQPDADIPQAPQKDETELVNNQSAQENNPPIQQPTAGPVNEQQSDNLATGQIATDDNTGSKWYIDSNNTLHIGAGVLKGTGDPDKSVWGDYSNSIQNVILDDGVKADNSNVSYLFYKMPELKSVDLNGIDLSGANATEMFSYGDDDKSSKLESVNTTGVKVTIDSVVAGMFKNCVSLKSLDLSDFDTKYGPNSDDMLLGTNSLTTLTLTNKMCLTNTLIEDDYKDSSKFKYCGYEDDDNNKLTFYKFMMLYNDVPKEENEGIKTWKAIPVEKIKYTIKYYYHDVDSGEDVYLGEQYDKTGEKYPRDYGGEGSFDFVELAAVIPGYSVDSGYLNIPDDQLSNLYYENVPILEKVVLDKYEPEKIILNNLDVKNDTKKEISSLDLIFNDKQNNSVKLNNFFAEIPSMGNIDFDNTAITSLDSKGEFTSIKLSDKVDGLPFTYNQYLQIINSGNQTPNEDGTFDNLPENMTLQEFINVIFDNYFGISTDVDARDQGSSLSIDVAFKNSTGTHSHSHGSSSPATNKGITIKQTQDVATMTKTVNVYNKLGNVVTNRALAANTGWISDEKYTLNDESYYRVATDEYVKTSDVYVYVPQRNIVLVHDDQIGYLVNAEGNKVTNRALQSSTDWITDRYTMINGEKYYRVATNEFVNESYVSLV